MGRKEEGRKDEGGRKKYDTFLARVGGSRENPWMICSSCWFPE
jgi:hypothetical protein